MPKESSSYTDSHPPKNHRENSFANKTPNERPKSINTNIIHDDLVLKPGDSS